VEMGRVALLAVALGALLAVSYIMFTPTAPQDHAAIAESFQVIDTRSGYPLKAECVNQGKQTLGYGLATFSIGEDYETSTWIWSRGGDTEWVMTIWGPDDSGVSYIVEFGRVSPGSFSIKLNGEEKVSFESTWSTPAAGYWWTEVKLSK